MSGGKNGIAVAGSVLVDKINQIAAYPEAGQLTQITDVSMAVGGCVPNVALDLKKISPGMPVWAVGRIGKDAEGEFVAQTLQGGGVDVSALTVSEGEKTSFTEVMSVIGGQRTFFTYPGASADFGCGDVPFGTLEPEILHLGYFLLLKKIDEGDGLSILKEAKSRGIRTSIDLVSENSDRYGLVLPCLPYTDYLIINEFEAGMLTGMVPENRNLKAIAEKLLELGVREKVIIHKPDVAVCCSREGFTALGSYILPEDYIQGTTGAGDAFCAGALTGIYKGLSDEDILSFASSCAVMALRCPDATGGLEQEDKIMDHCRGFSRRGSEGV